MNSLTLRKLEYEKIIEMVVAECSSSLGKRKAEELSPVIDYEEIIQNFLKKENITAYMLNSLIEKIEIDQNKQVTIYYKFADLNTLS